MTTATDELLPCPFCGGMPMQARESADERSGYCGANMICCNDCTARVRIIDPSGPNGWAICSGMPEAITAWNTRADRQSAILEGAEIMREAAKKAIYQLQLKNRAGIDDDNFAAALGHASDEIGNLDPAAIIAQRTRTKAMDELIAGDADLI